MGWCGQDSRALVPSGGHETTVKAVTIVIDSFGIGFLPDAVLYGDAGANTALHICEEVEDVRLSNLMRLGLGNCSELLGNSLPGIPGVECPLADFGVMKERSPGKDTTTGHWELAGVILDKPFPTYPASPPSFPDEIMVPFCWAIGSGILGNESASGTEIIERLGAEHMRTGKPIVYTSADSVFQIAAHEEVVATKRLYEICQAARGICDRFQIGRVIARPFLGSPGNFVRTERRRDFSIALPEPTILDSLSDAGVRTVAVGKIGDIFNQQGISENYPEKGNPKCLNRVLSLLKGRPEESFFMFVNLVDTDMIFGHRRDPTGYHEALAAIDVFIPRFVELMDEGDLLIISADHGCDPTFRGNDHTREYVPLLALRKGEPGKSIGVRESFADHAQSIAQFFSLSPLRAGESFIERPTSNAQRPMSKVGPSAVNRDGLVTLEGNVGAGLSREDPARRSHKPSSISRNSVDRKG